MSLKYMKAIFQVAENVYRLLKTPVQNYETIYKYLAHIFHQKSKIILG